MGSYTKHEAMDRAFLAVDYVENTLVHHEYYTSGENEEFNKLVDEAVKCLSEAYQVINRTDMEAMKKSFLDCMSELVGMLPKVEDEGEESVMEIKAGQIWERKTDGTEAEILNYIERNNAVKYKYPDGYVTDCAERFKKSFEFVRNKGDAQMIKPKHPSPIKNKDLTVKIDDKGFVTGASLHKENASKPDMVNKPPHYKDASGIECKEITCHRKMPFSLGNAIKYLYRAGSKGDLLEDLKKAEWYLRVAYLNDETVPEEVVRRLREVAAVRKTAAGRALNLIGLHMIVDAYGVVKIGIEKLDAGDE